MNQIDKILATHRELVLGPFHFFENGSIQGERNGSNYSGVFFGRTLSRDAVDRARREETNIAIAVK